MAKRALITWGGWDGHQPDKVAALFAADLRDAGFEVDVTDSLACFDDAAALKTLDLIVPVWTMSTIEKERSQAVADAVEGAAPKATGLVTGELLHAVEHFLGGFVGEREEKNFPRLHAL